MIQPPPPPAPAALPPPPAVEAPPEKNELQEPLTEQQAGFFSQMFAHMGLPPSGAPPVPLNDVSFVPPPQPPPAPKPTPPPALKTAAPVKIQEDPDVTARKEALHYKITSWLRICPHLRGLVQVPDLRSDVEAFEFALAQCKRRCMGLGMEQTVARSLLKLVCGSFEQYALPVMQSYAAPQMLPLLNGRYFALDVATLVDAKEQNELQMAVDCCAIDLSDYLGGQGPWMMLAQAVYKTFADRVAQNNQMMVQRATQEGMNAAANATMQKARDLYSDL